MFRKWQVALAKSFRLFKLFIEFLKCCLRCRDETTRSFPSLFNLAMAFWLSPSSFPYFFGKNKNLCFVSGVSCAAASVCSIGWGSIGDVSTTLFLSRPLLGIKSSLILRCRSLNLFSFLSFYYECSSRCGRKASANLIRTRISTVELVASGVL